MKPRTQFPGAGFYNKAISSTLELLKDYHISLGTLFSPEYIIPDPNASQYWVNYMNRKIYPLENERYVIVTAGAKTLVHDKDELFSHFKNIMASAQEEVRNELNHIKKLFSTTGEQA